MLEAPGVVGEDPGHTHLQIKVFCTSTNFNPIVIFARMSNSALGEWTNVGGAIDMKVYTEEEAYDDIPMNLATPHVQV